MKRIDLPLIALAVGVSLMVLSSFWPRMTGGLFWNEQRASEHAHASAEVHRLSHERVHAADHGSNHHAEQNGAGTADSLNEARRRYERSHADLQQARSRRDGTARILRWAGAACAILGGIAYVLLRSASE